MHDQHAVAGSLGEDVYSQFFGSSIWWSDDKTGVAPDVFSKDILHTTSKFAQVVQRPDLGTPTIHSVPGYGLLPAIPANYQIHG